MIKHNERNHVFTCSFKLLLEILIVSICVPTVLCSFNESKDDCQTLKLDLVIIVDTSTSVGESNFILSLDFIRNILRPLPIGPDSVRVALLRYSSDVEVVSYMNDHMSKDEKIQAVSYINYTKGFTYTDKVLNETRTNVLVPEKADRQDVKDLVILITDGQSTRRRRTLREAAELKRKKKLQLFTIGVTKEIDEVELKNISSSTDMFLNIETFTDLNNYLGIITPIVCSGGAQGIASHSSANISISESSNSRTIHDKLNINISTTLHILKISSDSSNGSNTVFSKTMDSESVSKNVSLVSSRPLTKETSFDLMLSNIDQGALSVTLDWTISPGYSISEFSSPPSFTESVNSDVTLSTSSVMSLSSLFVPRDVSSLSRHADLPTMSSSSPSASRMAPSSLRSVAPVSLVAPTSVISMWPSPSVTRMKTPSSRSFSPAQTQSFTPVTSLQTPFSPSVTQIVLPSSRSVTRLSSPPAASMTQIFSSLASSAPSFLLISPSSPLVKSTFSTSSSTQALSPSPPLHVLSSSPLSFDATQYVTTVISSLPSPVTPVSRSLPTLSPSVSTFLPVHTVTPTASLPPMDPLSTTLMLAVSSFTSNMHTPPASLSPKSQSTQPSPTRSSKTVSPTFLSSTFLSLPIFQEDDYAGTSRKPSFKSTIITSSISEDNYIRPTSTQQTQLSTSQNLWGEITSSKNSISLTDHTIEKDRTYMTTSYTSWNQTNNITYVSNTTTTTFRDSRNQTFDVYLIATGVGFITIVTTGILLGVACRKLKSKSRKVN